MRLWCLKLAVGLAALAVQATCAADPAAFFADPEVGLGVGGTYHFWARTGSVVVPVTVGFDQDRWELGVFRVTSSQGFFDSRFGFPIQVANPYWGVSVSRRLEFFKHRYWRMLVGLGGSYKTEQDDLSASHWNFAEQFGVRVTPAPGAAIDLVMRHWSDAGLRLPNRGQDFATLMFVVTPGTFLR